MCNELVEKAMKWPNICEGSDLATQPPRIGVMQSITTPTSDQICQFLQISRPLQQMPINATTPLTLKKFGLRMPPASTGQITPYANEFKSIKKPHRHLPPGPACLGPSPAGRLFNLTPIWSWCMLADSSKLLSGMLMSAFHCR